MPFHDLRFTMRIYICIHLFGLLQAESHQTSSPLCALDAMNEARMSRAKLHSSTPYHPSKRKLSKCFKAHVGPTCSQDSNAGPTTLHVEFNWSSGTTSKKKCRQKIDDAKTAGRPPLLPSTCRPTIHVSQVYTPVGLRHERTGLYVPQMPSRPTHCLRRATGSTTRTSCELQHHHRRCRHDRRPSDTPWTPARPGGRRSACR